MIQEIEWFISTTREMFSNALRQKVNRNSRLHRTSISYDARFTGYIIAADIDIDGNGRHIETLSYAADLGRFRIFGADAIHGALMRVDSMIEEAIIEANISNMREERDLRISRLREESIDAALTESHIDYIRNRHDSEVSLYLGYRTRYRSRNAVSQRYSGGGGGGGVGVPYHYFDPDSPFMYRVGGGGGGAGYGGGRGDFVVSERSYSLNEEEIRRLDEAAKRGIRLLRENLTEEQLASFDRDKSFCVTGGETRTRYRIHYGKQMNIRVLCKNGSVKHGLCFLPSGNLCIGDTMLAQKLALECNEMEALRVANKFSISPTSFVVDMNPDVTYGAVT